MKNTNIDWIGNIPDDWKLESLKGHLEEVKESNDPVQTTQVLSLTNKLGVIPYEEKGEQGNKAKENYNEYKLAYPNTIVANSMNILIGSVGICNYFGCVSPVYYVFKPKNENELKFLDYIFQSQPFQKELRRYAKGILEIRLRVSANDILRRQVAVPSSQQQKKIVDFLEAKLSQVDELIANQQGQIEKLKEYKQSVITEAVTKGLDKSTPMKDSGIEWIGEIPAHWGIIATKSLFDVIAGATPDSSNPLNWDGEIRWITPADYKTEDIYVEFGRRNLSKIGFNSCSTSLIPAGNIIFSKRAPIGAVAINNTELCTNQGCLSCVNKGLANIKFYYYIMSIATEQYELLGSGTTFKEISCNTFSNFRLPYPSLETQQQIADYLDEKCGKIDRLIAIKQEKIEKLQEYKKSLIYEYVTGKKEVV